MGAFERARAAYGTGAYDDATIEFLFPELKESEDERCRKAIIEDYKVLGDASLRGAKVTLELKNVEEKIAWLEKQKEQKGSLRVIKDASEWEKIKEQKPAEWSEEDLKWAEEIRLALLYYSNDKPFIEELTNWFNNHIQPNPHWKPSEEQMIYLKEAINKFDFCDAENAGLQALYEQLKKLH